jgi:hypothetical protein
MRQTSIECYKQIKAEGLLSKRRLEVLETLLKSAPCTSSEAITKSGAKFGVFGVSSRFTELRDLGVIYEVRVRKCTVTNRNVIEWDLTDKLPVKVKKEKAKTKKEKAKEALSLIESLGKRLNEPEKSELRDIWHLIKKI